MNNVEPLDRQTADTYAAWFRALADGTRVQIVSLLARAGRPLTVKEIVAAVPVGQSTVSEHLRQLAAVRFVLAEDRGTSRLYRINDACVSCFPTAADLVMGGDSGGDIPTSVLAVPFHLGGAKAFVPVVVEIDGNKYQAVISGTSVQTPPGLTLEKRTDSKRVPLGGSVTYRLLVTNTGEAAALGVRLFTDDGRGVPEDLVERLFLPLVSGRADGTGLGLPLAQQVAREHGGAVDYRSRPGHTVFSLLLPMSRVEATGD